MNQLEKTITSLEVSEMVGRDHNEVLKDVRRIIGHLDQGNLPRVEYFIESTYRGGNGQERPSYLLTKKGCELYSTRMTGEKGTQFAVAYIERFNKMENHIKENEVDLSMLSPELRALINIEKKQLEQDVRLETVEKKQDDITQILSLNPTEWRKKVNDIINKIASRRGGTVQVYQDVRNESYELLESRAKCRLSIRLNNRKRDMALEGASKSKVDKVNKMDVIASDDRLTEIYLAIVKEMAIKNGVTIKEEL